MRGSDSITGILGDRVGVSHDSNGLVKAESKSPDIGLQKRALELPGEMVSANAAGSTSGKFM